MEAKCGISACIFSYHPRLIVWQEFAAGLGQRMASNHLKRGHTFSDQYCPKLSFLEDLINTPHTVYVNQ